jgi:hypothetical protein
VPFIVVSIQSLPPPCMFAGGPERIVVSSDSGVLGAMPGCVAVGAGTVATSVGVIATGRCPVTGGGGTAAICVGVMVTGGTSIVVGGVSFGASTASIDRGVSGAAR